jgi:hypothetical protein
MASLASERLTQLVSQLGSLSFVNSSYPDPTIAECVSEETKRPLISLTSADIGTDPASVEDQLRYWFKLAKAWSAILLLDEADVFLERRSATDLVRNNLVAIFLRTLEYYQGIFFLTTNRIGTFDEAFISRIDVPIYFPALTNPQRIQIWSIFFRKLEEERQDKIRVAGHLKYYIEEDRDLLGLEWNGREIRSGSLAIPSSVVQWLTLSMNRFPNCRRAGRNRRSWKRRNRDHYQEGSCRNRRRNVQRVQELSEGSTPAKRR